MRAWGSLPPPPQAAEGGAVGPPALRGGARRATLGAGSGPSQPSPRSTAEMRARTAMNSATKAQRARARGRCSRRPATVPARSPACAAPRTPVPHARPSPGPRPFPLAPRRRRPPAHPGAGWCPRAWRERASSGPPRRASRRLPPCLPR